MNCVELVSSHCRLLAPYKPGLTTEKIKQQYEIEDVYKYASNESPFPPSPLAIEAMQQALAESNRYPDYDKLKGAIANQFNLHVSQIILGTGSINVLELIFQIFNLPGNNVVFSSHSYFAYPLLATKTGLKINTAASDNNFAHVAENLVAQCDDQTSLLVIDNPTNFAGTALNGEQIKWILSQVSKKTIVVLDQAYAEFADIPFVDISPELFERYPNLIITRTFSKAYSLASMRIGYGLAHPEVISWLDRQQQPFPISHVANQGAIASLQDTAYSENTINSIKAGRKWLNEQLNTLGISTSDSHSNFVLGHFGANANALYQDLLENGFITRQMSAYNAPEYIRISIGTALENERLIEAITARQTLWSEV
ncbi:histidinol-phosphate transaminase [Alteromonas sp. a30]|uniref:histidinol-phosphate transaminase n=1 Tax=Alteromonas sp. a30 TaxID=2730917 RepID=UPI00227FACFA|nr:histidinol-phosphate transaminase [Alteromonas sp. a30]MCY7294564.1 histidinol-phosphate transaminase [Alteromonas sp. a30]